MVQRLTIGSLTSDRIDAGDIASITMLGSSEKITWKQDASGLHVVMPTEAPKSLYAFALKIAVKSGTFLTVDAFKAIP